MCISSTLGLYNRECEILTSSGVQPPLALLIGPLVRLSLKRKNSLAKKEKKKKEERERESISINWVGCARKT
jgi:hypothetical protein